jgi:hypothetical protein
MNANPMTSIKTPLERYFIHIGPTGLGLIDLNSDSGVP